MAKGTIYFDYVVAVVELINRDISYLGISGNEVADLIEMSRSSFHAFRGLEADRPRRGTLHKLLGGQAENIFGPDTIEAIMDLLNFGRAPLRPKNTNVHRIAGMATLVDDANEYLAYAQSISQEQPSNEKKPAGSPAEKPIRRFKNGM